MSILQSLNKLQLSKVQTKVNSNKEINTFDDQIHHVNCHCYICCEDIKPIPKAIPKRIISPSEVELESTQGYLYLVERMVDFVGQSIVPDMYLIDSSKLIYYSYSSAKIKCKEGQTMLDVKKHFDDKRKRYKKIRADLGSTGSIGSLRSSINLRTTSTLPKVPVHTSKQVAIMIYKDNTHQLLIDTYLSKILLKRKNDPYWADVAAIVLIPPYRSEIMQFIKHHYYRHKDNCQQLEQCMNVMAQKIDNVEEDKTVDPTLSMVNVPYNRFSKRLSSVFNAHDLQKSQMKNTMLSQSHILIPEEEQKYEQTLHKITNEIIAFIEVQHHIQILKANFEFMVDLEGNVYLMNISDYIGAPLQPYELRMVHNRYEELGTCEIDEIIGLKFEYEEKQENQLWKVFLAMLSDCLEARKIELAAQEYKKPSFHSLKQIFLKMFPKFTVSNIFDNQNWKNELKPLMLRYRKKIERLIRQDEGIRILKRYDITFHRTFN